MHEPDVTLTDYLLALECLIFVGLIFRTHAAHAVARVGLLGVFGSLAAAAILGGTSHGFFPDHESAAYKAIWIATMLSIGAATWGAWIVFAWTSFAASAARVVTIVTALIFAGYAAYVIFIDQPYLAAIAHYALVSLALMIVFAVRAAQSRARPAVLGLLGLVLTFVAGVGPLRHRSRCAGAASGRVDRRCGTSGGTVTSGDRGPQ